MYFSTRKYLFTFMSYLLLFLNILYNLPNIPTAQMEGKITPSVHQSMSFAIFLNRLVLNVFQIV